MGRAILVYQGTCRFCCVVTSAVLAWDHDRRIRPVALETSEAAALLVSVTPDLRTRSWHLVDADGALFSAGRAFPELFRLLPGGRGLAVVAGARPGLTERTYGAVASRRGGVGRVLPDRLVRAARGAIDRRSE